ncbi:MAG: hypothetical protein RLY82_14 [Pseudomonadota bacterium]|jgi:hypothetical protein
MTEKFEPTNKEREQVEAMSGYGLPHENIAALIRQGIDSDTLKKHFKSELATGKAKANAKVGQTLFQKATGGDTTAMIWWSKTQMKWAETQKIEHTSPDGSMSPKGLDASLLSDSAIAEVMAARVKSE